MKVLSSVIAAALGAPEAEPAADPYYAQYQWPGAYGVGPYGHGFSSTCYGCRPYGHYYYGKRSADANPDAYYGHYRGLYGGYGHGLYARAYGYGPGVAYHGTGTSYVHQGIQGLPHHLGKREAEASPEAAPDAEASPEAEADPEAYYGYYGYGLGVARHPYGASYVGPTVYGYPSAYRYGLGHYRGYGLYGHYGHYGKREAEAAPEAEADPEADAHFGYGYGYRYLPYGHRYLPYRFSGYYSYPSIYHY